MRLPRLFAFLTALLLAGLAQGQSATQEAPIRAGRLSWLQGDVTISSAAGVAPVPAERNWPVTEQNELLTGRDGRAEVRIGSTALRLDNDSALDVSDLGNDNLRLRLHYGSVNLRVRNPELARGFEVNTPQGRITLREPAWLRIDTEMQPETTTVTVLEGSAEAEAAGTRVVIRANYRADLRDDEIRTGSALRIAFDDWAAERERAADTAPSLRYVSPEVTGYEDLDAHGSWNESIEYGPVWIPSVVNVGWAPYRDGRWLWVAPWGWTWIDNAPWGYAPFHYGRWVEWQGRWCWVPGPRVARPVWAPALVGWVGTEPALGWYPLHPREVFVPAYPVSRVHIDVINVWARPGFVHRGTPPGLVVLPREHFDRHRVVVVEHPLPVPRSHWVPVKPPAPVVVVPRSEPRTSWEHRPDWNEHRHDPRTAPSWRPDLRPEQRQEPRPDQHRPVPRDDRLRDDMRRGGIELPGPAARPATPAPAPATVVAPQQPAVVTPPAPRADIPRPEDRGRFRLDEHTGQHVDTPKPEERPRARPEQQRTEDRPSARADERRSEAPRPPVEHRTEMPRPVIETRPAVEAPRPAPQPAREEKPKQENKPNKPEERRRLEKME